MKTPSHPPIIPIIIIKNGKSISSVNGSIEPVDPLEGSVEEEDDPPNELNALAIWLTTATAENQTAPTINPRLIIDTNPRNPPFTTPSEYVLQQRILVTKLPTNIIDNKTK